MTGNKPAAQWRELLPIAELGVALLAGALWYTTGGVWYRDTSIGLGRPSCSYHCGHCRSSLDGARSDLP